MLSLITNAPHEQKYHAVNLPKGKRHSLKRMVIVFPNKTHLPHLLEGLAVDNALEDGLEGDSDGKAPHDWRMLSSLEAVRIDN